MTAACKTCRFWLPVEDGNDCPVDGTTIGWCRFNPPAISDRMAQMTIPPLGNRSDNYDPSDVADVYNVERASLFPATGYTQWCGRFERNVVVPL